MIVGHESQYQHMEAALRSGRLHHAYLFSGPRGLGKAGFAETLLPALLGRGEGPKPETLLASGAHPDFMRLALEADPKTGKMRSEITRDQVQRLLEFLTKHAALAQRKVVLIDSADDLNVNAANNLLKWLEEPRPRTCLLLISHRPDGLLPTIRSRCAVLRFSPLDTTAFAQFVAGVGGSEASELWALSGGVPGEALALMRPKVQAIQQNLADFVRGLDQMEPLEIANSARDLLVGADAEGFRISLRLLRGCLRVLAGCGEDPVRAQWAAQAYALTIGREEWVAALNMDLVQTWTGLLLDLHELARQGQHYGTDQLLHHHAHILCQ